MIIGITWTRKKRRGRFRPQSLLRKVVVVVVVPVEVHQCK